MKIGFIEDKMMLVSSGACNLMMEWYKLLQKKHFVQLLQFTDAPLVGDGTYKGVPVRAVKAEELEEFDILITNYLSEYNDDFAKVLSNCKKPITIFVYHDRTVARDIFTNSDIMNYINACDYVMTYQPRLLVEKLGVPQDKVKAMDIVTYYKDPTEYLDTTWLPQNERDINILFCNRTNNFKGTKLCMDWCHYLNQKGDTNGRRLIKGFSKEFPHNDLPAYTTEDFEIDYYGPHSECKELLRRSKFVWLAQDYSKYPTDKFSNQREYLNYLNFDPDGTTLEAIFNGCIPIMHKENKKSKIFDNELKECCLFYDPALGYDDLYRQYKQINITKAQETLRDITELYSASQIFLNGLELCIMPQGAFELTNQMAKEVAKQI